MGKTKLINIPKDVRTILDDFELGRPARWTHKNLIERSLRLVKYARKIIEVRGQELGISRDRDYKQRKIIKGHRDLLTEKNGQIERLQEVASAAAWVIADHMSGSYDAVVGPHNKHITSEEHGDGICRVLALHLAKLRPEDKVGIDDFVDCDFERVQRLLQINLPEDIRR